MPYKVILVHADDSADADARVATAAQIAADEEAHLVGVVVTSVSQTLLHRPSALASSSPGPAPYRQQARERAERAEQKFRAIAQRIGVASVERVLLDADLASALRSVAPSGDLLVVGHPDAARPATSEVATEVLIDTGTAVLLVPSGPVRQRFAKVLVAWDGSAAATRAVRHALPLLARAERVTVATLHLPSQDGAPGAAAARQLIEYLRHHQVAAEHVAQACPDIGTALLALATGTGADLLVMGCYGQSPLRERLLGGTTRTVLAAMPLPVLMAH